MSVQPKSGWILLAILTATCGQSACGADWPQWRGPQRTGISAETGWMSEWSTAGPKKLWSVQVGEGFSSVAVVGGRLYTVGNAGGQDTIFCLNASTGAVNWKYSYPCAAGDYGGPRATPTVDGANVYTVSRDARAFCLDAASGKLLWQTNVRKEAGAETPQYGFAGSPLVEGGLVLFNVGVAGAALEKSTGRIVWKSGEGSTGYSSPAPFTIGNQHGVAFFSAKALIGVDAATGRTLWRHPWETQFDINAADPIFAGSSVFISSNYNRGCALINLEGGRPAVVWESQVMRNHFNACVLLNGFLYGNDQNTLKCIDGKTGQEKWKLRGIGKGGVIASDGKLIVLTERGELVIVQATADRYNELARAQVIEGTCWTHPVLANGRIYCRSHEGGLTCVKG